MQDMLDLAKCARFDHLDQPAHAVMQRFCLRHIICRTIAAFGSMGGGPTFGCVDHRTRKQLLTGFIDVHRSCQFCKDRLQISIQMGL